MLRAAGRRSWERALQTACAALVLLVAGCARSDLLPVFDDELEAGVGLDDAGAPTPDAEVPLPDAADCIPAPEQCNGVDDDCNGRVDELPPVPCPNGGSRYCVAGRMSECPNRCEVCRPGTERVCFLSYCTFWASQTCAADGRSFGRCREELAPPECEHLIDGQRPTRALEQCCIDNQYCCVDHFDLDRDGNVHDMVGRCEDVACE